MSRLDIVITGAFAAIAAAYAALFYYRAPYFDHWDLARLLEAADAGTLSAAQLFELHGGHWHAGAYALLTPLARLTGWSHLAESMLSVVFMAAACGLGLRLAWRFAAVAAPQASFTPFVIAVAWLAFSLDQASNMLWGFQLSVFVSQFGVLLAIAALTERRLDAPHLTAALIGLAIGVSSYATAFALVPLGLALIALHDAPRRTRFVCALAWALVSLGLCAAFLRAQAGVIHAPATGLLGFLALFELTYVGAGVARFAEALILPVAAIGLALGGGAAIALARRGVAARALAIPLALCAFGLGAGLLCGVGRHDFGADQGANARYVTFANTFWLGVAMLALARLPRLAPPAKRALAAALALLVLLKAGNNVQSAFKHASISREVAAVAEAMRTDPDAATRIAAPQQDVAAHVAFLRAKKWSAFR